MMKVRKKIIFYICLAAASLLIFGGTYGFAMLDPGNISYIYNSYDTEQHYFGWVAYRDAGWEFLPGLHDRLIYPDVTSVIFTDSIPFLAFIFKLLSPVLPEVFQYFGLWTLMSLFLTGMFSAWILWDFCQNDVSVFLSSVLMMLIPTVMIRTFVHEALGGQWLVVMALWIFFWIYKGCGSDNSDIKNPEGRSFLLGIVIRSAILGFLVAGTHMYFIPICGMILAGCTIYMIIKDGRLLQALSLPAAYVASGLFAIWLWGGFSTDLPMGNDDYTIGNPANLNTLFNPLGYSRFLPSLPLNMGGQDDGFGYPGLGVWIVMIAAFCVAIKTMSLKTHRALLISVALMFLMVIWFSTYPVITFGEKLFFTCRLPDPVNSLMAVFRCNGRGIWAITYTLAIAGLMVLCKKGDARGKNGLLCVILAACILLQTADLTPLFRYKYEYCKNPRVTENLLSSSEDLNALLASGKYRHVFMDESLMWAEDSTNFAMENHLTTNRFYLARQNEEANARRNEEGKKNLSDDTLYIFPESGRQQMKELGLTIVYNDDYYYVGVVR